ncbi:MAG: transglutaminase domain-containing protein [Acidobacteriia bacterium]|nr:transglutaminase domain-containing protein [Terriglobia bacterium]
MLTPHPHRRDFLRLAGIATAAFAQDTPQWRTFQVVTRVEVLKPSGTTRIWVPAALSRETPYQRTISDTFQCEGGKVRRVSEQHDSLGIIAAEFPAGVRPVITVTSKIATRNISLTNHASKMTKPDFQHWTRSTKFIPTDGIVKENAIEITRGAASDADKARAIYEWIVDNTYRNPKTRGCGLGNIRFMLESRDLGGKCADLNALYVGLARAAGLPARDVYGIRIAPSKLGYKSLGTSSDVVTKAQHCRAEVFLSGHGWVAVDPADVRKVMLEEPPGNRPIDDAMVKSARARLFGSWEMNWMAYNFAHDVALPGSAGKAVPFLMYPQAETGEAPIDSLDPDSFKYEIRSTEIS